MPGEVKGYLLVVVATVCWGLCGAVSKYFFNQSLSPLILVTMRLTISAFLLISFLYLRQPGMLCAARGDRRKLLLFGLVGVAGVQFCYLYTISQMNVAAAVFLLSLAPAFVALYSVIWLREPLGAPGTAALALACAGSALIVTNQVFPGMRRPLAGIITGFISAICYAFYMLYGKGLIRKYNSWGVLAYGFFFGALPFWFLVPPWVVLQQHYTWQTWVFFLYIGILGTIIPFGLFFKGLRCLQPYRASIAATLEPVMAGIFAYYLIGETLCRRQLLGCFFILAAVIILNLEPHLPRHLGSPRFRTIPWRGKK